MITKQALAALIEARAIENAEQDFNKKESPVEYECAIIDYTNGATLLQEPLLKAIEALKYVKEHELFHGVNQGVPHEQTVDNAISEIMVLLGVSI